MSDLHPHAPAPRRHHASGVTIVELLLSIVILGVLVTVIASAFLPVTQSTLASGLTASANARARSIMDAVRAQWRLPPPTPGTLGSAYDRDCIVFPALGTNEAITSSDLILPAATSPNSAPTVSSTASVTIASGACASAVDTVAVPMKRVIVTVRDPDNASRVLARLTLDVPRPQ